MNDFKIVIYAAYPDDLEGLSALHLFRAAIFVLAPMGPRLSRWEDFGVTFHGNNPDRLREYVAKWIRAGSDWRSYKPETAIGVAKGSVMPIPASLSTGLERREFAEAVALCANAQLAALRKGGLIGESVVGPTFDLQASVAEAVQKAAEPVTFNESRATAGGCGLYWPDLQAMGDCRKCGAAAGGACCYNATAAQEPQAAAELPEIV